MVYELVKVILLNNSEQESCILTTLLCFAKYYFSHNSVAPQSVVKNTVIQYRALYYQVLAH